MLQQCTAIVYIERDLMILESFILIAIDFDLRLYAVTIYRIILHDENIQPCAATCLYRYAVDNHIEAMVYTQAYVIII